MVCSHCQLSGHTFRKCPTITPEEKAKKIKENKDKKNLAIQRRIQWEQRRIQIQEQQEERRQILREKGGFKKYTILNENEYELVAYWGFNEKSNIYRISYIPSHDSVSDIDVGSKIHRLVIFPTLAVIGTGNNSKSELDLDNIPEPLFNKCLNTLEPDENIIIIPKIAFNPPKSELDQWKETALKSNYLLQQLINLGAKQNENLEPILDMVEDIKVPEHNDYDKEMAGIPSALTNIT